MLRATQLFSDNVAPHAPSQPTAPYAPILAEKLDFLKSLDNKAPLPSKFDALLIIDMQKEFCKIGKIRNAIFSDRRGNQDTRLTTEHCVPIINQFRQASLPIYSIYFSPKPRHPLFIDFYGYEHRIQDKLVHKNTDSAFKTKSNNFAERLNNAGHKNLLVMGFNTSACVKTTLHDAQRLGFNTWLMLDCTGNDNSAGDSYTAEHLAADRVDKLKKMKNAGVEFTTSDVVLKQISLFNRP